MATARENKTRREEKMIGNEDRSTTVRQTEVLSKSFFRSCPNQKCSELVKTCTKTHAQTRSSQDFKIMSLFPLPLLKPVIVPVQLYESAALYVITADKNQTDAFKNSFIFNFIHKKNK